MRPISGFQRVARLLIGPEIFRAFTRVGFTLELRTEIKARPRRQNFERKLSAARNASNMTELRFGWSGWGHCYDLARFSTKDNPYTDYHSSTLGGIRAIASAPVNGEA